jgi:hypothetical protein
MAEGRERIADHKMKQERDEDRDPDLSALFLFFHHSAISRC